MADPQAAAAPVKFPYIELDQLAAGQTYHKVDLTFKAVQDGTPFFDQLTTYHHCSPAIVAYLTGNIVGMTGPLGPKGNKPKNQQFDISVKLTVDGAVVAQADWNGMSREGAWLFEKYVLKMWHDMNENSGLTNKAYGKV